MATLFTRTANSAACKNVLLSSYRFTTKVSIGDPIEHVTGLEKRELLTKILGDDNPFDLKVIKQGPGTKEKPNNIPSAFEARDVGCICDEDATSIKWMCLYKGRPRRCECGHWFNLIHKPFL